ncbi:MAG: tRNA (5-methylaminomethyl-2-thiouridine)(34)-methyltransferase MnmD [bacterium]
MKNPFQTELIATSDGSHTLKLKGHDEQYHSVNGALQESEHVFIKSGLDAFEALPNPLFVLEIGLGTGLNALLTGREACLRNSRILYEALEPYPVDSSVWQQLNYPDLLGDPWLIELFEKIHTASSERYENFRDWFFFRCFQARLQDQELEPAKYHLVFFDAFGPDTQPEMWTREMFETIFQSMKPGGVLVTYCVKGEVRRVMKASGFEVSKIPGPKGKREMSRAVKPGRLNQEEKMLDR